MTSKLEITRQYLKELQEVRSKYGLSDFPKYLKECEEIDKKYGYAINNIPDDELSKNN
ncbi:hypothetical protein mgb1_038 [Bacillus phage MG-B1]|uniref:Uncharacterized protein n=1 Tax=Bacillus phage MG-B1 TaxID=1309583 RepID=M4W8D8_9CAUD|nr:hypothetical protein mgb1_038 [Bacillus phage MG-B1]AGI10627.1 hypothetical protein mgb1_038 [Bacillus phage MG-B1]